jgi:hypothetical protein
MSDTKTFLPLGGSAQLDNEESSHHDYIRHSQIDKPITTRITAAEIKAIGLVVVPSALGLFLLLWIVKGIACWSVDPFTPVPLGCMFATGLYWFYLSAGVALAIGAPLLSIWSRIQRTRVEVERAGITRDRWSNPVSVRLVHQQTMEYMAAQFMASAQFERDVAPFKQYPTGLDALSISSPAAKSPEALPDNGTPVKLLPAAEWLALLNDPDGEPHILLAGKTKAGKSTLAEVILARRVERGDEVLIIDPHYQPINKYDEVTWCGLRGVGGDSWQSVKDALSAVRKEYERRKKLANLGEMPRGGFPALTVVIDEVPEIYESLRDEWEAFQAVMGSGARKYSIYIVLITQSHLIKDIGGSTAKRENFVVIGLNEKSKMLVLSDVNDTKEKQAMLEALRGQEWSAAMIYRNDIHLLDRTGTKEMRPASLEGASVWSVRPEDAESSENGGARTDGRADGVMVSDDDKIGLLRAMRRDGTTRDQAREKLARMGLGFENADWTEAGK